MHERLRIHHGVGSRVLFDSDQGDHPFTYEKTGDGWTFRIHSQRTPAVEEVLRLKDEINLFIFKEEGGKAVEKLWFYTGDGSVSYREDESSLVITASRQIAYKPGDFEK
ncbi:hypothetical protein [Alicyclobacillus fastidiosus]|uniref:Uncharacterized protein n=1 Tax=Alicyclobacillus fastidiosus TaxID=392011 RepID=A0ABV5ACZ2_9BACL|nr:hypothetical protein [Alicyclobacillus fastidiosus]WEH08833.1 hypothetical protein PYS47_19400 [Alicyclobacillus fastidiosus]